MGPGARYRRPGISQGLLRDGIRAGSDKVSRRAARRVLELVVTFARCR